MFHNIKNPIFLSRKNCYSIICATDANLMRNGADILISLISTPQRILRLQFIHWIFMRIIVLWHRV